MNEVNDNEVLSDYSESELTSNESYSAEEEVVDEIEEDDGMSDADSVIEVSDEEQDPEASNFAASLREVLHTYYNLDRHFSCYFFFH